MARKDRNGEDENPKKKNEKKEPIKNLKSETVGWVSAIGLTALAVFFLLASFGEPGTNKAGWVGDRVYPLLTDLLGIGYFLLPIICLLLAVAFARSQVRPVTKIQGISTGIFFLSSLAFVDLFISGKGGFLGNLISNPLLKLFDIYVSTVILIALMIASIIVIFDAPINLSFIKRIFVRNKNGEEEMDEDIRLSASSIPVSSNDMTEIDPGRNPGDEILRKRDTEEKNAEKTASGFNIFSKSYISAKAFVPPPLSLLEKDKGKPGVGDVKGNANIIKRTLQNFGIIVEMDEVSIGPSVTRYALKPAEGVKLSKILGLQNNLELALAAHPVRIEAPIPGKSLVGIEIPNSTKTTVGLATLLEDHEYKESQKPLIVALGKGISGEVMFGNLAKMPHVLIAGATGSGKSVTIHTLINSLLFRNPPENLKFIMIDPKRVELTLYNKIPHLLTPVITDAKKTIAALKWAAKEMDRRYNILEQHKVRDIDSYHKNILAPSLKNMQDSKKSPDDPATHENMTDTMPYIVIIIDELADIMQTYPRELESAIVRLAQMSRAVGMHLVLSTQRPSVNVITGLIKANVPARIALQVASQIDSRTILDMSGAEKLLGAGDMLFMSGDMSKPVRLQSAYISENEVKKIVDYLAKHYEDEIPSEINLDPGKDHNSIFSSDISDSDDEDDLYGEAKEIVIHASKASTSFLQRKLRIGYARAARLMDILEDHGVIGPGDGAKPRDVLVKPEGFGASEDFDEFAEDDAGAINK